MISILWVDDEIELLKPHIIYLEGKGYKITPVNSGNEAIELLDKTFFQLVFLDENMPGLSGLETLSLIKKKMPIGLMSAKKAYIRLRITSGSFSIQF